ncbi:MAG: glutamyl-tRNA reductase [Phycisphaerae bacterium]|nr:glutamyl-tRNA reductase [Phycisphaerae bacterium]
MQIILIGINHKTAPVYIRQRLALDTEQVCDALAKLKETFADSEFVLLSTCNRVEFYAAVNKTTGAKPIDLAKWLAEFRSVEYEKIEGYLYVKINEDAVTHLFTVSSSLDSMVIGESQITSQVKESYKNACQRQTTGKILNRLFHDAFRATKEIITRTSISNRRVSVAGVAVSLAKQLFSDIKSEKIVIVGAGQMGELLVEHFRHEKCENITVVNRSCQRGCQLAQKYDVANQPWEQLDQEMATANIVVGAASAQEGYLFNKERIKSLMPKRRNHVLLIVDITVPRSFDPKVGKIEDVYLYCIDDLAQVAQDNIKLREGDLEQAIEIIYEYVSAFMDWFMTRDVTPLFGQIKSAFEKIRETEMENFFVGPRQDACCRELMEASMNRIINKLCHCVIKNIDTISKEHSLEEAEQLARNILADAQKILSEDKKKSQ